MYTRKQYMNKECNRDQYYAQFVDDSVILRVSRMVGVTRIIESNDEHFNDIPLHVWDAVGITKHTGDKIRAAGTFPSLSDSVCIAKNAARQIKEAN